MSNETILSHLKTEFKLHRRNNAAIPPSAPHQTTITNSNQFCLFPKATAFSLLTAPDLLSESLSSEDQDLTLHGNTSESVDTAETLELAQQTQDEAEDENDDIFELKFNSLNQAEEGEEELEDDVIPFDACEYEKIEIITPDVCYKRQHTAPHTLLHEYYSSTSTLLTKYRAVKSKSLSCLNDCHVLSYFRLSNKYLTRTMSHVNLNLVEEETQTSQQNHYIHHHHHHNHQQQQAIVSLIKTSKTESEIFGLSANLNETSLPNETNQMSQMSHEEYADGEDLVVKQKKHNRKHRSRYNYSRIGKMRAFFIEIEN